MTGLLQPHLGPQHGHREQVSILGGPNDDRVRILAHIARGYSAGWLAGSKEANVGRSDRARVYAVAV